jgi:hypothetical protein
MTAGGPRWHRLARDHLDALARSYEQRAQALDERAPLAVRSWSHALVEPALLVRCGPDALHAANTIWHANDHRTRGGLMHPASRCIESDGLDRYR